MSIEQRRAELAEAVTAELSAVQGLPRTVTVDPYRAPSPAPWTGWLELDQTDTEGCTYGEVRCTFDLPLLIAADRTDFEPAQDVLTVPLMQAIAAVGGRGVTVKPTVEAVGNTAIYALTARFVTEALILESGVA